MGGKEGVLGARPPAPAHQDPRPSCRTSPVLLSHHHPHQRPGTYPLSRQAGGASITPGALCTILARVPSVPLQGEALQLEGTALPPAQTPVRSPCQSPC